MNDIISNLIIILSSIAVGMIIGLTIRENNHYHGPNSAKQTKRIYYHHPTRKCIRFNVELQTCAKSKNWKGDTTL